MPKEWVKITKILKQTKDDEIEITTDPPAFEKQEYETVGGMLQQVTNTYINRGDKLIFRFKDGINKKFIELAIQYSWQYKFYELYELDDTEIIINTQDIGKDRDYDENDDGVYVLELRSYEIKTKDATPPEPEPEPEPENDEKNYLNIYKITNDIYYKLMGHMTIDDPLTPIDNLYISNLYTIPFNIDNIVQPEKTPIVYGKNESKVEAYPISKDKIRVELGQIEIPSKYNNAYDYINTTTVLYCPLIKPVELNYKYCINQTLTLFYEIDLATARTDLVIKSSLVNNEVFYIEEVETLTPIEFISEKKDNNIKEKNRATIKNYIGTPQIQVIRNTPYINNDNNYISNFRGWEFAIFKDLSGYVEIEEIDLNFKCLKREADILKNILKTGIIKD